MNSHSLGEHGKTNNSGDWRDKLLTIIMEGKTEGGKDGEKERSEIAKRAEK